MKTSEEGKKVLAELVEMSKSVTREQLDAMSDAHVYIKRDVLAASYRRSNGRRKREIED